MAFRADAAARTAGLRLVTEDNMGSEWLHFLGLEYQARCNAAAPAAPRLECAKHRRLS